MIIFRVVYPHMWRQIWPKLFRKRKTRCDIYLWNQMIMPNLFLKLWTRKELPTDVGNTQCRYKSWFVNTEKCKPQSYKNTLANYNLKALGVDLEFSFSRSANPSLAFFGQDTRRFARTNKKKAWTYSFFGSIEISFVSS